MSNANSKETAMKNVQWFLRHPVYAAVWFLTGRPYSAVFKSKA